MRKAVVILALLLAPTAVWAQGTLRVLKVFGPVEWKAATGRFLPVNEKSQQSIQVGDQLKTGPDAEIILGLPDESYIVVSENSNFTVQDYWSGNLKSIMNLIVGRVRFYIQKPGGKPNPYSVKTPTALIAVRGTVFDVIVAPDQSTEVQCTEGSVKVENIAGDEVVLERGFKTFVRQGERPFMPVAIDAPMNRNRVVTIYPKSAPNSDVNGNPANGIAGQDNDRRNRINNPAAGPNSTPTDNSPQRAKPTLTFP